MTVANWLARINMMLALLCGLLVLSVAWIWLRAPGLPDAPRPMSTAARNTPQPWQWFATAKVDQTRVATETLEEARLDAALLGIVHAADKATAILRMSGAAEKVYQVGDELQSGVRIEAIEPYRVVVMQNGRRQQISMIRMALPSEQGGTGSSTQTSAGLPPGFTLGEMFTAVPVGLDNQNSGLKLDALSEEMRQLAELQEGDVIVRVGNHDVQELMQNPAQWMLYSTNGALPVMVLRDGQESVIHVNAPALALRFLPALGLGN